MDRAEVVFPRITTTRSTDTGLPALPWKVGTELPPTFHVMLTWRGRERRLTLFQSDVASGKMVVMYEDSEQNATVAETKQEKCHYHGFLKKERASYVAVSTCDGLVSSASTVIFNFVLRQSPPPPIPTHPPLPRFM